MTRLLYVNIIIINILFFMSCSSGELRRPSLIAVDVPPITLTPARTAAERQLVGERQDIEPDGWIIASSVSSVRGSDNKTATERETENVKEIYRLTGFLEFYQPYVDEYKSAGVLGESFNGLLAYVPDSINKKPERYRNREEIEYARTTAERVNQVRIRLNELLKTYESSDLMEELAGKHRTFKKVKRGEWWYASDKSWKIVK